MAEYIDREAVIAKYKQYLAKLDGVDNEFAISVMRNEPTADVVEVVHGRWERDELFTPYCTVCGESPMSALRPEGNYHYCPNCGARMDGE